jgi:hypothetical protein
MIIDYIDPPPGKQVRRRLISTIDSTIRDTILQLLVFCARFLLWLIVMSLFTRIYETFLQKELFGYGRWAKPEILNKKGAC